MGKKRIKQLKMANEDEDKTIHKLEKLLKIDKNKRKKGIPRMFNDGLDYALEMCLPENIDKMYAAAKEAADADQQSDSEWQEDLALATGALESHIDNDESKNEPKTRKKSKEPATSLANGKKTAAEKRKAERLREIESKYFGASDDELASDLSDVDSEFEKSEDDQDKNGSNDDDFDDDNSDDDAPDEVETVTKSSKKRHAEKQGRKSSNLQNFKSAEDSFSGSDFEDDSDISSIDDSDEEETNDSLSNEPKTKKPKMSDESDDDGDSDGSESEENEVKPDVWEDIYGRKRDKDGNIIKEEVSLESNSGGKYIPPHLRAQLAAQAANETAAGDMDPKRKEKLLRLKRILKGQINRLSEANMHKITTELDNLYMQNSRHDMNTTLTTLICDALISQVLAPERMVMEHALLIAALHANVGTEVGANLLETCVDRFHNMIENGIEQYDVEDKTLDNVIFLMCHMYTFKVRFA